MSLQEVLEVGVGQHPDPRATVKIDVVPNACADLVMDVHDMTFEDRTFDMVLMFEVLEHLRDPLKALGEIRRVLKPRGRLVLTVPNAYYWKRFARWALKGVNTADRNHIWNWSIWEMRNLVEKAGFEMLGYEMCDIVWHHPRSRFSRLCPRVFAHHLRVDAVKSSSGPEAGQEAEKRVYAIDIA